MKATGVVRKIDELGRIVLPLETRQKFGLNAYSKVEIYTDDHAITLVPVLNESCIFCNSNDDLFDYEHRKICKSCRNKIKAAL